MDRGTWGATVHGVEKSDTTEKLGTQDLLVIKMCGYPAQLKHKMTFKKYIYKHKLCLNVIKYAEMLYT